MLNHTVDQLDAEVRRLRAENTKLKGNKTASKSGHSVTLTFTKTDHTNLQRLVDALGVTLETFVVAAINRRIQDAHDLAITKCRHFATGQDQVCVLCGETIED